MFPTSVLCVSSDVVSRGKVHSICINRSTHVEISSRSKCELNRATDCRGTPLIVENFPDGKSVGRRVVAGQ